MEAPLYPIVQAGFILLTLAFMTLFVREFQRALRLTGWDDSRKKTYLTRMIAGLILWAAFVSTWSLTGRMADFSRFPFNFIPVILIPILIAVFFISSRK